MNVRIETFQNMDMLGGPRAYVSILQALTEGPTGKQQVGACMVFFAPTLQQARALADAWLLEETSKVQKARDVSTERSDRMKKRHAKPVDADIEELI